MTTPTPLSALRTLAEIRSILGRPYSPCGKCGSPSFSILHTGQAVCWGCEPERAHSRLVALEIVVLCRPDGSGYAVERQEAEAEQERRRMLAAVARDCGGRIVTPPHRAGEATGAGRGRDAAGGGGSVGARGSAATLPWMQEAADAAAGRGAERELAPAKSADWLAWTRPDGGRAAIRLTGRTTEGIRRELSTVHPAAGAVLPPIYHLIEGTLVPGGQS